jgi:hypothetical protein
MKIFLPFMKDLFAVNNLSLTGTTFDSPCPLSQMITSKYRVLAHRFLLILMIHASTILKHSTPPPLINLILTTPTPTTRRPPHTPLINPQIRIPPPIPPCPTIPQPGLKLDVFVFPVHPLQACHFLSVVVC